MRFWVILSKGIAKPCIQNIGNIPVPTNKDMRRSIFDHFKKFSLDFVVEFQTLLYLLKKDAKFVWDIDCEKDLKYAKKELQNPKSFPPFSPHINVVK